MKGVVKEEEEEEEEEEEKNRRRKSERASERERARERTTGLSHQPAATGNGGEITCQRVNLLIKSQSIQRTSNMFDW